ncbi:MAG: hypothetical protein US89_C0005G0107 [Candidatus Peregrinibacteria bacterium GW2011_GWF2_38_29]|nr:MAG: hypothetical protein US89_C0005G0107 [Candidatus Peregrinibacteria bacterium GW2011_GWF2_38_29]HBB02694.1 hypothetical protein [Candidatus Peregrinibacteria bacterium]
MATDSTKLSFGDRLKMLFSSRNLIWMLGLTLVIGSIIYFTGSTGGTSFKGNLMAEGEGVQAPVEVTAPAPAEAPAEVAAEAPAPEGEIVAVNDEGLQPTGDGFSEDAVITQDLQSPDEQQEYNPNADEVMVAVADDSYLTEGTQASEDAVTEEQQTDIVEDIDAPQVEAPIQPDAFSAPADVAVDYSAPDMSANLFTDGGTSDVTTDATAIDNSTNSTDGVIAFDDSQTNPGATGDTVATTLPAWGSEGEFDSTQTANNSVVKKAVKKAAPKYKNMTKTGPETLLYAFFLVAAFGATRLLKKQN